MQRSNHWFVAYDQGLELRVSGWNPRSRLRAGAKHLCGHTCLHRLVDDFMARTLAVRVPAVSTDNASAQQKSPRPIAARNDTSLTSSAHPAPIVPGLGALNPHTDTFESSARLITPFEPPRPVPALPLSTRLAAASQELRPAADQAPIQDTPGYSSRNWRADAWKREREREERATHPSAASRHRSIA